MRESGIALLAAAIATASSPTWIGRFTQAGAPPAPWGMVRLKGEKPTAYRVTTVEGRTALEARVDGSMSLMARPISVDLGEKPALCWRWYVDAPVAKADMTRKSGDDYAARVYIAFDMPDNMLSGSTRMKLKIARSMFGRSVPDAALVY